MACNKKSSGNSWVTCERCGCQEWAGAAHTGSCSPFGAGPWLRGVLEVSASSEEVQDAGPGSVVVSTAAARQCGLVLGETVIVRLEGTGLAPLSRRLWVSRAAAAAAVILSERELETGWGKQHRTVSVCALRRTVCSVLEATEVVLGLAAAEDLVVSEQLVPLLKRYFLHRLFTCQNEIVYWHYGKKLQFPIVYLSPESEPANKTEIWYRLNSNTRWFIQDKKTKDNCNGSQQEEILGGADDIIEELEGLMRVALERGSGALPALPPPRGVLLFGHSGTGKTAICRHLIRKLGYRKVTVDGPSIFSKYFGETEKTLLNLFRDAVDNEPSVIVVDDVDTICPRRNTGGTEQEKRVSAAFLSALDSLQSGTARVFVLATAARPDSLDPALRRAGRLDRELEVSVPDRMRRRALLSAVLHRIPHQLSHENIALIADAAHGYVAADVLNLCTQASTHRIRDATGTTGDLLLRLEDLQWALTVVKASAMREVLVEVPNVRWSDIGGQQELKAQLRQSVEWPLKHADRFESLGIQPPSGVLMYGPPGCSKTLIAKALATESGLNFLSIKGPELFSKWVGESERAVREVFARARRVAPAVVFFDELDALGSERGTGEASGVRERVLAQLLTELDGVVPLRGVLILGATNRPDRIDRALLRPGRLDRLVYVPLPDRETRADIFRIKLARVPLAEDVQMEHLVESTEGYSGAEVQAVCHEAVLRALDEDINSQTVNLGHFKSILKNFKPRTPTSLLEIYETFLSTNR